MATQRKIKTKKTAGQDQDDVDIGNAAAAPAEKKKSAWERMLELVSDDDLMGKKDLLARVLVEDVKETCQDYGIDTSTLFILFDEKNSIAGFHANRIYRAIGARQPKGEINLLIESPGGQIEPAYLISKTCKRLAVGRFSIVVPRKAKSAATLICLGADEVHMGLMSELGPIDPQLNGIPAMALSNALSGIAELVCRFPASQAMFAEFLAKKLDLRHLGYYQRINESAEQYATRLVGGKVLPGKMTASALASHFVNHYKDHSFVIDADEATGLLGQDVVKIDTRLYYGANLIYLSLSFISSILSSKWGHNFRFVGAVDDGSIEIAPVPSP